MPDETDAASGSTAVAEPAEPPSGTEPVLRVYAEGRAPEIVKALLEFGERMAAG